MHISLILLIAEGTVSGLALAELRFLFIRLVVSEASCLVSGVKLVFYDLMCFLPVV